MKLSKPAIRKIARENKIEMTHIKITRDCSGNYGLEDSLLSDANFEKNLRMYNQAVKKLVKALCITNYGLRTGYGAWHYRLHAMSACTELALANID